MNKTAIIIPSRLDAQRLPNKPLKLINNKEMILHVYEAAKKSNAGEVYVATPDKAIFELVSNYGGKAVLSSETHNTGTDRIFEALCEFDPDETYRRIINLQGDLPDIPISYLTLLANMLCQDKFDLCTLVAPCKKDEINAPQVVKAVMSWKSEYSNSNFTIGRAHYFSRAPIPFGSDIFWHHIGIYDGNELR